MLACQLIRRVGLLQQRAAQLQVREQDQNAAVTLDAASQTGHSSLAHVDQAHLERTGEGCTTSTSMPWCLTSAARLAPKADKKLLVAAYRTVKGEGMAAAAEDVKTKQPLRPFCTCEQCTQSGAAVKRASQVASQMAQAAPACKQQS